MFHCSRPVLLPSPSYACVPSRPARRQSLHVVDLNSCIPTLGYLPSSAAVRQISAAKARHRGIGPLVHHALPWGRMHSFSLCLSYLLLVPRVGGRTPKFFYSRFFPRGERCSSRLERRRKRSLPQHLCWGQASRERHVLSFQSFHLACCPRRAQIGTWFLGVLMFHAVGQFSFLLLAPGLLPSTCTDRSPGSSGDLMFHCSRPVLLPSPSYAYVPSRPARRQSLHVRSPRRRLELVHSNTWVHAFFRRSSSNFRG